MFEFSVYLEDWKPVKNAPGYFVSNAGRVASTKKYPEGRLLTRQKTKTGTFVSVTGYDGGSRNLGVAKLVWEAFGDQSAYKRHVRHFDRDIHNNVLENLFLA